MDQSRSQDVTLIGRRAAAERMAARSRSGEVASWTRGAAPSVPVRSEPSSLAERLRRARRRSLEIAAPLTAEDMTVQAMDDASPTKWHLAHVTWFFETFLLVPHLPGYRRFDERFAYCFNSYYETMGARHPRPRRGVLTRPTCEEVLAYREHVDAALGRLLAERGEEGPIGELVELGIHHEQQHQELMLTDILALFAANPLAPVYRDAATECETKPAEPLSWISFPGGLRRVGTDAHDFSWDNERPEHAVLVTPYRLASRLVTNGEWLAFMADGGYTNPLLWLADGWTTVQREGWRAPGYWCDADETWRQITLHGFAPIDPAAPVTHVSYYEADAFARWCGKRLPSEQEWEAAVRSSALDADEAIDGRLTPAPARLSAQQKLRQVFGCAWQWTASAYLPYPGYRPPPGAIGEYNGKFMVSQHVLRGSSCLTPEGHARATYRNFFYPHQRWQMTGVRLADEAQR